MPQILTTYKFFFSGHVSGQDYIACPSPYSECVFKLPDQLCRFRKVRAPGTRFWLFWCNENRTLKNPTIKFKAHTLISAWASVIQYHFVSLTHLFFVSSRQLVLYTPLFHIIFQWTKPHFGSSFIHIWFIFYRINFIFSVLHCNLGTI